MVQEKEKNGKENGEKKGDSGEERDRIEGKRGEGVRKRREWKRGKGEETERMGNREKGEGRREMERMKKRNQR